MSALGQSGWRGKCSSASGLPATADITAAEPLFGLGANNGQQQSGGQNKILLRPLSVLLLIY
jgi:hypothetical protein